jgi:hypothetical protein
MAVQVVAVEDGEAQTDQGHFEGLALVQGVPLDELAVGVADEEVGLLGEHRERMCHRSAPG